MLVMIVEKCSEKKNSDGKICSEMVLIANGLSLHESTRTNMPNKNVTLSDFNVQRLGVEGVKRFV